jgi:hypothetical protein
MSRMQKSIVKVIAVCAVPYEPFSQRDYYRVVMTNLLISRLIVSRSNWKSLLFVASLLLLNCHQSTPNLKATVSARSLADEYERSSAAVRSRYDGKEITIRGYAELAAVMPGPDADQGSVLLDDKELKSGRRVICWFSQEQSQTFSSIKGEQYITVRGVFNGEAGVDLKFCKLVGVE